MSAIWKRVRVVAMLLVGGVLGAALALPVTYRFALRRGEDDLLQFARRILAVGEQGAAETRREMREVRDDHLPFCSDEELALMRRLTYNSRFVRDLGRSKNGLIYCTAARGRLPKPIKVVVPDLKVWDQQEDVSLGVSPDRGVAIAPGLRGIIVDLPDVSAVLNQAILPETNDGPFHGTALSYDRPHGIVLRVFGRPEPLHNSEIVAQGLVDRGGTLYQPLCSTTYSVCAVGAESKEQMWAGKASSLRVSAAAGAVLGALLAAIVLLFYDQQQSFERRLRRAVRNKRITCVYQPIVDLDTGAILGAEALARWTTNSGESVPPDVFIPVAEAKGFICRITDLVLARAIDELGELLTRPGFRVTINISSQDLADPTFPDRVQRTMAWTGISPSAIVFELTEYSTANLELAAIAIAKLRANGHAVYLDDFGTGYSSLAYLQHLQVDAIKIDRAFTSTVGTDAVTASVVPQIMSMASQLRLSLVVEGIETSNQADYFRREYRNILGQGWFFGRPMSAAQFMATIKCEIRQPETEFAQAALV